MSFVEGAFRTMFMYIDNILAWLITSSYNLIMKLADADIFGDTLDDFKKRIFVFIAIFMLFKLSFAIIQYILEPDKLTDSKAGGVTIVKKVIIVLALLTSINWAFDKAFELQSIVLNNNIIAKVILGDKASLAVDDKGENQGGFGVSDFGGDDKQDNTKEDEKESPRDKLAKSISFTIVSAFLDYNRDVNQAEAPNFPDYKDCQTNIFIEGKSCGKIPATEKVVKEISMGTLEEQIFNALEEKDVEGILNYNIVNAKYEGQMVFAYRFGVSTICLIIIAVLLIIFCIDIAIRTVKLGFLQLIAPIPIIMYLDPNTSKDNILTKWLSLVGKTFVDLFVRLAAIFFSIYILNTVTAINGIKSYSGKETFTFSNNPIVIVLIIIGSIMFAKQLPDLIKSITGINVTGGTLKDLRSGLKKASPFAAAAVGLGVGALGGFAANTGRLMYNINNNGIKKTFMGESKGFEGFTRAVGTAFTGIGGMFSSGLRGARGAYGQKGFFISAGFKAAGAGVKASNQAAYNRDVLQDNFTAGERLQDKINEFAGIKNKYSGVGRASEQMEANSRIMQNLKGDEQAFREARSRFISEQGLSTQKLKDIADYDASTGLEKLKEFTASNAMLSFSNNVESLADGTVKWKDGVSEFDKYVDSYKASHNGNFDGIGRADFETFVNQTTQIIDYDTRYEELKKANKKLEKAQSVRNSMKK